MGYLFVIDGIDCSGKKTVTQEVSYQLKEKGYEVVTLSFPMYQSVSSGLVKDYLSGEFGTNSDDVAPKVASSFFAIDRIGSYLNDWKKDYEKNTIILCDRYVSSNAIHQSAKLATVEERKAFVTWLDQLEYEVLRLPRPTQTFYISIPLENTFALNEFRLNKITEEEQKDIHEENQDFMRRSHEAGNWLASEYGWQVVANTIDTIAEDGLCMLRPIEETAKEIVDTIEQTVTCNSKL